VTACRDPGGTPLGEQLRKVLLHKSELSICRQAEMFLYMASRAQMVQEVIRPALETGQIVVSDRYLLANVVYQGHAGGMDVDSLWQVGKVAVGGIEPSAVFVLDMPVERAATRFDRELDRMESQGGGFMEGVRQGYLAEAARREEVLVIDADRSIETIQAEIRAAAAKLLPAKGGSA
jgi:dTMP kinase